MHIQSSSFPGLVICNKLLVGVILSWSSYFLQAHVITISVPSYFLSNLFLKSKGSHHHIFRLFHSDHRQTLSWSHFAGASKLNVVYLYLDHVHSQIICCKQPDGLCCRCRCGNSSLTQFFGLIQSLIFWKYVTVFIMNRINHFYILYYKNTNIRHHQNKRN